MGNNPAHPRYNDCVQFNDLEEKTAEYTKTKKKKQ